MRPAADYVIGVARRSSTTDAARIADRANVLAHTERMIRAGGVVVTTVESAVFQLVRESGDELFKRILPIVRRDASPLRLSRFL